MVKVKPSDVIEGVLFITPESYDDERGRFVETYRSEWVQQVHPAAPSMVQSNRSESKAGVLRGMHYHLFQADYWYLSHGSAFVALYDFRASSRTAEKTETLTIKEGQDLGIYIPPGVAHGFFAITDTTLTYMVDQYFDGTDELGVYYDDPGLEITWPIEIEPMLSDRDKECPMMLDVPEENLPL